MRLSLVFAAFLAAVVYASPRYRALKNVGAAPAASASASYVGDEWVGNVQCTFHLENDCALSIQAAGRRIDAATHRPNEDVLMSCLSSTPSMDLVIHALTFDDVQDYTCLQETNREYANVWLNVLPVIEASGSFVHGGEVSLTCNAPLGASLFWQLPGAAADHQGALISRANNTVNTSATVTFTITDADHFAAYNCCLNGQTGQPPNDYCTTYVVTDEESLQFISSKADYSAARFDMSVALQSKPLLDAATATWGECITLDTCVALSSVNYEVQDDPACYSLTSDLQILDNTNFNFYKFSVQTVDGSIITDVNFTVNRLSYYPMLTKLPSQIYYNQDDATYTIILKVTVGASPSPTVSWQQQTTNQDSLGSVDIVTGGIYAVTTTASSTSEWETTLVISPYDPSLQDAIYTVVAENENGCSTLELDVSVGPSYLTLSRVTGTNSFQCQFESFPEANYEINVVAAYDSSYTVSGQTYDPLYSLTTLSIDVTIDPLNTYYVFSCTAYNPHDASIFKSDSITVVP